MSIDPDKVSTWNLESLEDLVVHLEDQAVQAFQFVQDRVEQGRETVNMNISIISSDIKKLADEKTVDIEDYLENSEM